MRDRHYGKIIFICDSCDEEFVAISGEEFEEVWARAREAGWRTRMIADEWLHGCPTCGAPT